MLEIGAIQRSNSHLASAVVLIRKKDGSLHFFIDVCKVNAHTIKVVGGSPHWILNWDIGKWN